MSFVTECSMNCFIKPIESVEDNAALAMTATIRRTNTEKFQKELGLESLQRDVSCKGYAYFTNYSPQTQDVN